MEELPPAAEPPPASPGGRVRHCLVAGCTELIADSEPAFFKRARVCRRHAAEEVVEMCGVPSRFCQQCGRFHEVSFFDGTQRSCREQLAYHAARRRLLRKKRRHRAQAGTSSSAGEEEEGEEHAGEQQQQQKKKQPQQRSGPGRSVGSPRSVSETANDSGSSRGQMVLLPAATAAQGARADSGAADAGFVASAKLWEIAQQAQQAQLAQQAQQLQSDWSQLACLALAAASGQDQPDFALWATDSLHSINSSANIGAALAQQQQQQHVRGAAALPGLLKLQGTNAGSALLTPATPTTPAGPLPTPQQPVPAPAQQAQQEREGQQGCPANDAPLPRWGRKRKRDKPEHAPARPVQELVSLLQQQEPQPPPAKRAAAPAPPPPQEQAQVQPAAQPGRQVCGPLLLQPGELQGMSPDTLAALQQLEMSRQQHAAALNESFLQQLRALVVPGQPPQLPPPQQQQLPALRPMPPMRWASSSHLLPGPLPPPSLLPMPRQPSLALLAAQLGMMSAPPSLPAVPAQQLGLGGRPQLSQHLAKLLLMQQPPSMGQQQHHHHQPSLLPPSMSLPLLPSMSLPLQPPLPPQATSLSLPPPPQQRQQRQEQAQQQAQQQC